MRRLLAASTLLAGLAAAPQTSAAPFLRQHVSGGPGAWTIEFTIVNTNPADAPFIVSYLGINEGALVVTAAGRSNPSLDPWNIENPALDIVALAPATEHTIGFETPYDLGVLAGTEAGGFFATSASLDAPAMTPWVMQMWYLDTVYPGSSDYDRSGNGTLPIFVGVAVSTQEPASSTPEPASAALALMGLLGLAAARRRRG